MKTLIINGSPRKNGDTSYLIDVLKSNLLGEIHIVNTYFSNIKPCIDCRCCYEDNNCSIKDEMIELYKLIYTIDNIVIASPIYFSNLTGSLLNFASRLQFFYISRMKRNDKSILNKSRNGVILLTGGGDGSSLMAVNTAKILIKQMNGKVIDSIISHNTESVPASQDNIAIEKIKVTANTLNSFY